MSVWNPALYLKNAGPRLKPALDLLNRTVVMFEGGATPMQAKNAQRVLDLGCGPGNITPFLKEAFPSASVLGIDSSGDMITAARETEAISGIDFRVDTINGLLDASAKDTFNQYDVVYSNAALHWVTGHSIVFPRMIRDLVSPGGVLAVQMPDTRTQASHTLIIDACRKCGFERDVRHVRIPRVENDPSFYYDALNGHFSEIEMWSTEYVQQLQHVSRQPHPVLEYVSATGLMPVIEALGGKESSKAKTMLKFYEQLLFDAYPNRFRNNDGDKTLVLFPFKRFFLVAKKKL